MKALATRSDRQTVSSRPQKTIPSSADQHLWICIHLPMLAADALQLNLCSTQPFVIYIQQAGKAYIHIASERAQRRGIESGMELTVAYTLCAELQTYARNSVIEEKYLHSLVQLCNRYSPTISLQYDHAIQIEVKNSLNLFGGLTSILKTLHKLFNQHTAAHIIAVSPTAAASHLLASSGKQEIIWTRKALRSALGKCPLFAFPFHEKERTQLHQLGLRTGRDLFRLPTAELARRFGPQITQTLHHLLATQAQSTTLVTSTSSFSQQIDLSFETEQQEIILRYVHQLLKKLTHFLIRKDASVSTLTIDLCHSEKLIHTHTLHSSRATQSLQKWLLLITEHLHQVTLRNTINRVSISCHDLQPHHPVTQDLLQKKTQEETYTWQETLDQIKARLGEQCIYSIAYRAHHCPEQAHLFHQNSVQQKPYLQDFNSLAPRPAWLLNRPQKLSFNQQSHSKLHIGRNVERIESGWWERRHIRRDYYIAADTHHNLHWIFHDLRRPGNWFLHGHFS